jgi:hypothetical protein
VSPLNLGAFRIVFCALTAFYYLLLSPVHNYVFETHSYWVPQWGDYYSFSVMGVELFYVLRYLFIAGLVLSAAGVWTRPTLFLTAVAHFFYEFPIGDTYKPYTTNMIFYILIILALSPGVNAVSVESSLFNKTPPARVFSWPLWMIQLLLSITYFCSAISKVIGAGVNWFNGKTLQIYMYDRYLAVGTAMSEWASAHIGFCMAISILTFLFEATFFLTLFFPRWTRFYVVCGLAFHVGVYMTFRLNFLWLFCTVYLVFVDWRSLARKQGAKQAA